MTVRLTLPVLPLWLVLVFFWSHFANANLTVRPADTVVLVNHSTYFNCSTSTRNIGAKDVLWYHHPLYSAPRKDVYDDGQIMDDYKERFGIETNLDVGVFDLLVNWPSLADAGRYECGDGKGHGDKASAELIVLEGNPVCESNMPSDGVVGQNSCGLKPDELWMTCRITSFHGNIPPTLEWRKSNDESSSSLAVCERSASCNLTQRGDQIRNGQSFVCHTTKSKEQYGCSIGPVKVKYKRFFALLVLLSIPFCIAVFFVYKRFLRKDNAANKKPTKEPDTPENQMVQVEKQSLLTATPPDAHLTSSKETEVPLIETAPPVAVYSKLEPSDAVDHSQLELSAELSSLPIITDQNMVDSLTINQHFIDRGTSGAIYGPFRWKYKKCALKQILFSPDALTKELEESIHKKANYCKKLDHPHLVKVFEVWFRSPALYILMEYAEGKSLDKILRPKDASGPLPPFSLEIVKDWAFQIADGMRYLHCNDLVHRNLKAAHVLVMESRDDLPYTLKLGSYTLIKEHDHATVMSAKGTLAWMAPECIRSEPFSKLSDVWSYGVTVWEILTRDLPYKEIKKETDLVRGAINKTLKPTIPDSCPKPLQDLLTSCWDYDVDKRPSFTGICDYLRSKKKFGDIEGGL